MERKSVALLWLQYSDAVSWLVYVFSFPKYRYPSRLWKHFSACSMCRSCSSYIYQTRMLEDGFQLVWLIFLSAWGCDTCAYCTGVLIGKHKLAPVLSPKKSIEGAIGGVVGAALLGAAYGALLGKYIGSLCSDLLQWVQRLPRLEIWRHQR